MTTEEKILEIINKVEQLYGTKRYELPHRRFEIMAKQIAALFEREYLNECIEKATPNLSKIKDVDKELAEIRKGVESCGNCKYVDMSDYDHPCRECDSITGDKWEPIKTE